LAVAHLHRISHTLEVENITLALADFLFSLHTLDLICLSSSAACLVNLRDEGDAAILRFVRFHHAVFP
jgi:hypothetical protein